MQHLQRSSTTGSRFWNPSRKIWCLSYLEQLTSRRNTWNLVIAPMSNHLINKKQSTNINQLSMFMNGTPPRGTSRDPGLHDFRPQTRKGFIAAWATVHQYGEIWGMNTGWWCNNHLEKYEFVNGKDDIPYMKWKIKHVRNHQPEYE